MHGDVRGRVDPRGAWRIVVEVVVEDGAAGLIVPELPASAVVVPEAGGQIGRHGWDRHVRFGLENPRFYALLYGNVERGRPCAITSPALARLTDLLDVAAKVCRLRIAPVDAAAQLLAANVGVTLSLIAQPEDAMDPSLSDRVREAALAGVLAASQTAGGTSLNEVRASASVALIATLDDSDRLTVG